MHGDVNYKPTFSERNRCAELRYLENSLGAALKKVMWDGIPVDPFQAAMPCWVKWSVMCHDPKHSPIPHVPIGCENSKYLKRH